MKLANHTPFPTALFRSAFDDAERMYAAVVLRARYELPTRPGGVLTLSREQPQGLRDGQTGNAFARLEVDQFFPRTGTDLIVHGYVIPTGTPTEISVDVEAGGYRQELRVFGERVWEQRDDALHPSPPTPLTEPLALRYEEAYGGACDSDYGLLAHGHNPVGRGFCLTRDQALGRPLPRVEFADQLIEAWDDRPEPAGLAAYPREWGLRVERCIRLDDDGQAAIRPDLGFFDQAHPRLAGQRLRAGDRVRVTNMGAATDTEPIELAFVLPPPPAGVAVDLGAQTHHLDFDLEEVMVDFCVGAIDLSFRKLFDYAIARGQARATRITMSEQA